MCVCVCVGVCACVLSCPRGQLRGVFSSVATGGMEQGDSVMGGGVKNTPVKASSEVRDKQRGSGFFFQALTLLFSRLWVHYCLRQTNCIVT